MKSILIITSYFPPETGAASNRIFHLAEGLQKRDFNVSVITPLPNYPTGKIFKDYRGKFNHTSIEKKVIIHRLWVYASNSKNKLLRLTSMLSYSLGLVWFFMWHRIPRKVIVQSPPLLVAFTCMFFLRSKKRKLILNVSDLWPLAGLELGAFKKNFSYKILENIERFNYKKADLVLGQSGEILTHIRSIFPDKKAFLYRNYPNFEAPRLKVIDNTSEKLKIVYAGLLGVAQGINALCQNLDYSKIEFHIYGSGAEREKIEQFIDKHPELPIIYHNEVGRTELHKSMIQYDVAIIPLVNRIYGSVPSKIFEYSRLGLPILYFGGGEAETIVKTNHLGWVATAGNYDSLNQVVSSLNKNNLNIDFKLKIQNTAIRAFDFNSQLNSITTYI